MHLGHIAKSFALRDAPQGAAKKPKEVEFTPTMAKKASDKALWKAQVSEFSNGVSDITEYAKRKR